MNRQRHTLAARGLSHTYAGGRVQALARTDLAFASGDGCAVVGPSGSGKSTLLHLLLRILRPTRGDVLFDGQPVTDDRAFRRAVQFVPQDPATSLDPRRSVATLVREPLTCLRIPGDRDHMVREALEAVGLGEQYLSRRVHEISGGQAQRVAIARALVTRPAILLADEPVSGLDLPLRVAVLDLFAKLREEHGIGLVMVTHDLSSVRRVAGRLIVLADGQVVEDGPTRDVLGHPTHPQTCDLVAAIPRLAKPRHTFSR